jgi:fluoride exporter
MVRVLLVGLGGFAGAVLRYLLGGLVQGLSTGAGFPLGTMVVNLTGCFLIGLLSHLADVRGAFTPLARTFLFAGVLGGYTTFSTFGNESVNLFRSGQFLPAALNVVGQVGAGLVLVWAGRAVAQLAWR